jgi:hypothetical protein
MNIRVAGPVVAIVTLVTMAACGSNSSTTTGTPAKAAAGATTGAAGKAAGPAKKIDVCTVLPVARAAELTAEPYTVAVPGSGGTGWTTGCAYDDDSSSGIGVNVNVDTSERVTDTWNTVHTGDIAEISGLGDKAFWDNDNTLYAVSGAAIIQVNGLTSKDKSEALARVVVAALQ